MEGLEFSSVKELYNRLKPALYSKRQELLRSKIEFVKEEDIWNYLVKYTWKEKRGLSLHDLTNDILYANIDELTGFVLEKLKEEKREVNYYSEELL